MKIVFIFLCLALCATVALGDWNSKCRNFARCNSRTSATIVIRGPGKCAAKVSAYCSTRRYASPRCIDKDPQYLKLKCRGYNYKKADAKCYASVAVEAYTAVAAKLDCKGKYVYGCANALADARAVACSIARSVARLYVVQKGYPICDAAIDVLIPAIANVATYSRAGGCRGGRKAFLHDHDHDYADAFEKVFAKALAKCWTYCKPGDHFVHLEAEGEADVEDSGKHTHGDGASAFTGSG